MYCVCDGLKLKLQQAGNVKIQTKFYNGWMHDHFVSNVLVFAPNGKVIACALNAPGSYHDSTVASYGNIYSRLAKAWEESQGKCVVDSAFSSGSYPFLIQSGDEATKNASTAEELRLAAQGTSARQSAEWGMRALQGTFPRLKARLYYEERGERSLIISSIIYMFNFRTSTLRLNQLFQVYMPALEVEATTIFNNN